MGTVLSAALRCTVRDCKGALTLQGERLVCPAGHAFDRAREGYWNLLQPQDRRSDHAGDRDEAVLARRRWLTRGTMDGFVARVSQQLDALPQAAAGLAVDIGCGEGTLTARLLAPRSVDVCGVDLSTKAIRLAARRKPTVTWIVANADRGLPFADASVSLALSIFGRRPADELRRVLAKNGRLVVVLPAADDLIELREAGTGEGILRDRVDDAVAELAAGFALASRATWRERSRHDRDALIDALTMSYRGARTRERARLAEVSSLDLTLSAEILELVPRDGLR